MLMLNGVIITETLHPGTLSVPMFILLSTGILFVVIGNFMPKFKSNFYMGIKNPWTLSSDQVWRKTHRLGGKLYAGCGILTLLSSLLFSDRLTGIFLMVLVIGSTIIICLASWLWWRKESA